MRSVSLSEDCLRAVSQLCANGITKTAVDEDVSGDMQCTTD